MFLFGFANASSVLLAEQTETPFTLYRLDFIPNKAFVLTTTKPSGMKHSEWMKTTPLWRCHGNPSGLVSNKTISRF